MVSCNDDILGDHLHTCSKNASYISSGEGKILHVANVWGVIEWDDKGHVFFDISTFDANNGNKLKKIFIFIHIFSSSK